MIRFFPHLFFVWKTKSIVVQLAGMTNCPYRIRYLITSKWQEIRISICTSCHNAATEIHIISIHHSFVSPSLLSFRRLNSHPHDSVRFFIDFFSSPVMKSKEAKTPLPSPVVMKEKTRIKAYRFVQTKCVCSALFGCCLQQRKNTQIKYYRETWTAGVSIVTFYRRPTLFTAFFHLWT